MTAAESSTSESAASASGAWGPWWAPVAASLFLGFLALGGMSLWDPDEPRYADASRRMLATRDFIVPYFNDEYRFQKPILTYWLVALAQTMFGDTAFAARFFSVVLTAVAVAATGLWGNFAFGRPAGTLAAWMLALCPMVVFLARMCCPDAPQFGFGTLCFTLLWLTHRQFGVQSAGYRQAAAYGFWACLALTILAKGPIIAGMLAATLGAYWLLTGERPSVFRVRWLTGPILAAAIAGPWFLAIYLAVGDAFYGEAVGNQLASRLSVSFAGGWLPPGVYLASLAIGFAPWIAFGGVALWEFRSRLRLAGPAAYAFAWLMGPMVLIECFSAKQLHYLLPCYPAVAVFTAAYLREVLLGTRGWTGLFLHRAVVASWALLVIAGTAVLVGTVVILAPSEPRPFLLTAVALWLFGGVLTQRWLAAPQPAFRQILPVQAAVLLAVWLLVWAGAGPAVEKHRLAIPVAQALREEIQQTPAPILLHRKISPALKYYSGLAMPSNPVAEGFAADVTHAGTAVLTVLSEGDLAGLRPYLGDRLQIVRSWYGWLKVRREPIHLVRVLPPPSPPPGSTLPLLPDTLPNPQLTALRVDAENSVAK